MDRTKLSKHIRRRVGLGPIQIIVSLILYWALIIFFSILEVELAEDAMDDVDTGWAIFIMLPAIVLIATILIRSVLRK